jgi:pimeloyl-ACP methyl ester carboxylesterase
MVQLQISQNNRELEHWIVLPQERKYTRPLLLLHGAWHGAWCWQEAASDLSERGFEVHAISLRGHGASSRATNWRSYQINDYLSDLEQIVLQIEPTPIVVGHSLGGFVLQHYLQRHKLPGAVLLCAMPAIHMPLNPIRFFLRDPKALLRTLLTGDTRHFFQEESAARAAFLRDDSTSEAVQAIIAQLAPEPIGIFFETIVRRIKPIQGPQPVLVIAAEADQLFSVHEQKRLAAWYGSNAKIIAHAGHDLMLDPAWSQAADLIEQQACVWDTASTAKE